MGVSFVDCGESGLAEVQAFFARSYSPAYRLANDSPLLAWQFGRGPQPQDYQIRLAVADGVIQGCLGYIPVELSVGGVTRRAAWTANWVVDPSLRRLGLGPMLLRQLMQEFDAVLSLGLDRDAADILPRMGWTDFGSLHRYVAVLDAAAAQKLQHDSDRPWPAGSEPTTDATESGYRVDRTDPARLAGVETLWDRLWCHGAGTRRSSEFLTWRYATHPRFAYDAFAARTPSGELAGFAISRIEPVRDLPVTVGRLVEFVAEDAAARPLLGAVLSGATEASVAMLDFFCASRRWDGTLTAAGFRRESADDAGRMPIVFQPIDRRRTGIRFMGYLGNLPAAAAGMDWYVTKGDGDQDRPN